MQLKFFRFLILFLLNFLVQRFFYVTLERSDRIQSNSLTQEFNN